VPVPVFVFVPVVVFVFVVVMVFMLVFSVVIMVRMAVFMRILIGKRAPIIEHINVAGVDLGPQHLGHLDMEAFTQPDGLQVSGDRRGLLAATEQAGEHHIAAYPMSKVKIEYSLHSTS